MKRFNLLSLILLLTFAVTLPSCNKDDDDASSNSFTFDNTTIDIANGFLFEFGANANESFDFDVYLASDGISQGGGFGLIGMGDYIYLDLNTESVTGLDSGTYTWSSNREAFTITDATVTTNADLTNFTGNSIDANGGSVEVEVNGTEVTLDINLQTSSGSNITGFYKGTLKQ